MTPEPAAGQDVPLAWVPLRDDRPAALRLGRVAIELAAAAASAPAQASVEGFESELEAGRLSGTLLRRGGRIVGLACWRKMGHTGLSVGPIALDEGEASPGGYRDLLMAIESREGPVAFVGGPLAGLEPSTELQTLRAAGFARFGRMEMVLRLKPASPTDRAAPFGGEARAIVRADVPALAALHARAYRDRFDRYLFREDVDEVKDAEALVGGVLSGRWGEFDPEGSRGILLDGRIVAATLVARRPVGPMILDVMVDPPRRGRGLGRAVLLATLRSLAAEGVNSVYLNVTEGNTPALRLYRDLGFTVTMGPSHDWYSTRRIPVSPQVGDASGAGGEAYGSGR